MAQMLKHGLVNGPYKKQSAGVVRNNLCFFPVNNHPFFTCCGLRVGRGFKHLYTTYRLPKVTFYRAPIYGKAGRASHLVLLSRKAHL